MNPDRRIYITTGVLAVVLATVINVLTPRGPFAGSTMHREAAVVAPAQAAKAQPVDVSARAAQPRPSTSL